MRERHPARSWRAVLARAATVHLVLVGLTGSIGVTLAPASAHADTLSGARAELTEQSPSIDLKLERGHATMVVTRVVENTSPRSDEATFLIEPPLGAIAVRLRTSATGVTSKASIAAGRWLEGELMEATRAAEHYTELTGLAVYETRVVKDPALLAWRGSGGLTLQVFPVPAQGKKAVEYTLSVPLAYRDGAYVMHLPAPSERVVADVRVRTDGSDDIEVDGARVASGAPLAIDKDVDIRLVPRGPRPALDGALATFAVSPSRVLARARITTAPHLGEVPARAAVVVVIDTSRSMATTIDAAIGAARTYLGHFPDAEVEVLTFDRHVRSPFNRPLPVREAIARLAAFTPALANGSRIDEALAFADARLAAAHSPARRVLLLTDLRTREALTPPRVGGRPLASGAVLHVVSIAPGAPSLKRDDDSEWAVVPRATGGLLWRASFEETPDARAVFEEWARPKRIDKLKISGVGAPDVLPSELLEGQGIDHDAIVGSPVTRLAVEGELWSRPVRWSTGPSVAESLRWPALAVGTSLFWALSPDEQRKVATIGRAVSPVTSYLAVEPGVRPTTDGIESGFIGSVGFSSSCHGYAARRATPLVPKRPVERGSFLGVSLREALRACGAKTWEATVTIESTLTEIVDVREVALTRSRDAEVEACVAEHLWSVALPPRFDDEHAIWSVAAKNDDG